ncbi:MAG TPA: DUF1697 domain-containing protein [Gemmatimonadaceae bacterium]|jgi:uncharacterized protein (DUF1697 family)
MPRYVAFLRGVMPTNCKMPALKRCFERAGFTDVKTVLASGNVVFDARSRSEAALARACEAAMQQDLGRVFATIVRPAPYLRELVDSDAWARAGVPAHAKRVITFLRDPLDAPPALPIERDGARIVATNGREVFSAYLPTPRGPVFMTLLEQTFGDRVTTRTVDTVRRCANA